MEPPAYQGMGAVQTEKFNVFKAMRPLSTDDVVRGQFTGYRDEVGVAKDSDVETFCALRLFIDSWRWAGVPWYLRSGKCLAETSAEVLVELKRPPQALFADSAPTDGRALDCNDRTVFHFPYGLPGFEHEHAFVFLQQPHTHPLLFLQSLADSHLCFILLPILVVDANYKVNLDAEDLAALHRSEERRV